MFVYFILFDLVFMAVA